MSDYQTYFIQGVRTKCIKIGKALDPKKRLRELQCASAEELVLLRVLISDRESELHKRFAASRVRKKSEWFEPTDDLLSFIENVGDFQPVACIANDAYMGISNVESYFVHCWSRYFGLGPKLWSYWKRREELRQEFFAALFERCVDSCGCEWGCDDAVCENDECATASFFEVDSLLCDERICGGFFVPSRSLLVFSTWFESKPRDFLTPGKTWWPVMANLWYAADTLLWCIALIGFQNDGSFAVVSTDARSRGWMPDIVVPPPGVYRRRVLVATDAL